MKDNLFLDSEEIYQDRAKRISSQTPFMGDDKTLQVQVRRMKALGKSFEEIDHELNLENGKAKRIYG
jgi:hypothetical protein